MYVFIVNPAAGSGRSLKILPRLTGLLDARKIPWQVRQTTRVGEAGALACAAVREKAEAVVAVCGDGTLGEIADGLKYTGIPLLFAASGTGNDFVRSTGLSKDPVQALAAQLDAPKGRIDVGTVMGRCFLNVSGTGLDVDVLVQAEKHKKDASGLKPYLLGVRDAIRGYAPMHALVSYEGEPLRETAFSILSLGNGQYFGGGMRPVPGAKLNDGLLDVVEVRPVPKALIPILMTLFIPGLHARTALAKRRQVKRLRIRCPGMVLNLDGELIPCDDAEFHLLEEALTVQLPMLGAK